MHFRDRGCVLCTHPTPLVCLRHCGYVNDDVALPQKVKLMTPICLESNVEKIGESIQQPSLISLVCCGAIRSASDSLASC